MKGAGRSTRPRRRKHRRSVLKNRPRPAGFWHPEVASHLGESLDNAAVAKLVKYDPDESYFALRYVHRLDLPE